MELIINFIRKSAQIFLKLLFPRLYLIEHHEANVTNLYKSINNCSIDKKAKFANDVHITNSTVGRYSYISSNCRISYTNIGKFCSIGPNLICGYGIHPTNGISTSPAFYSIGNQAGIVLGNENKIEERLPITIGNDVFIGMNVTILDGVTIGDGAIIGAGTIVSKNVPPYAIVVGSPMEIKKYRFSTSVIEKLIKIKWWDFDNQKLQDVEKHFFNIDAFIQKYDR
jgi:virginiamycin A acetyltransferase